MTLLILCLSIFVFIITVILFYYPAKKSDYKKKRLDVIVGVHKDEFIDDDLEKPFFQRFLIPLFTAAVKKLSAMMPKQKEKIRDKEKNKNKNSIEKSLKLAGINLTATEFNAAKIMIICGFVFAALMINAFIRVDFMSEVMIVAVSFFAALIIPIYYLKFKISSRQEGIRNQLPDVMDLLSVSIEAGLGFDSALVKIGERLSGPLVEEMNMVLVEIQLGRPRREALRSLLDRSSVEELRTFVSSVIQAEQLGIPLKNVLFTQARQLRIVRRQKAEERAMKAPVKMMIPLVAFVFPVLFIILLGPTVLQVLEQFGGI